MHASQTEPVVLSPTQGHTLITFLMASWLWNPVMCISETSTVRGLLFPLDINTKSRIYAGDSSEVCEYGLYLCYGWNVIGASLSELNTHEFAVNFLLMYTYIYTSSFAHFIPSITYVSSPTPAALTSVCISTVWHTTVLSLLQTYVCS